MNINELIIFLFEATLAAVAILAFWQFRQLVDEVKELRKEIQSLNMKIVDILASDRMFEHRLSLLENQRRNDHENRTY
ncbi:MAG: hypothetical protein QXT45_04365 [Candidatus Bilamarchaeaceae archaeon]